jgi:hypothetical protein
LKLRENKRQTHTRIKSLSSYCSHIRWFYHEMQHIFFAFEFDYQNSCALFCIENVPIWIFLIFISQIHSKNEEFLANHRTWKLKRATSKFISIFEQIFRERKRDEKNSFRVLSSQFIVWFMAAISCHIFQADCWVTNDYEN